MAYFECTTGLGAGGGATIIVTYESSFYNKTMTCSNGTKTYTKITTSSGSTEFSVSDEGTWTITCNGVSVSLDVTLNYATQMKPTGSTATPVNDIQTWLKCGGIFNKSYTTINQVLADTTTLLALISDNNAVDYMVRSTNWANSVCANATAMTDIGANNYCANTLLSDATWASAIANSTYFESVLNVKIPVMTSNTTPSGVASASSKYASNDAYYAMNGNSSNQWASADNRGVNSWLKYEFPTAQKIVAFRVSSGNDASHKAISGYIIQGSNDDFVSDINNLYTGSNSNQTFDITASFDNNTAYKYYRLYVTSILDSSNAYCKVFQLYGRASS